MAKIYVISCRDAGVDCDFEARGSSMDEVMQLCADHGAQYHNMKGFGPELYMKMAQLRRRLLRKAASGAAVAEDRGMLSAGSDHAQSLTRTGRLGASTCFHQSCSSHSL